MVDGVARIPSLGLIETRLAALYKTKEGDDHLRAIRQRKYDELLAEISMYERWQAIRIAKSAEVAARQARRRK